MLGDKELPRTAAGLEALQEFVDTVKILVDAQGQVLQNSSPEAKQEVGFGTVGFKSSRGCGTPVPCLLAQKKGGASCNCLTLRLDRGGLCHCQQMM